MRVALRRVTNLNRPMAAGDSDAPTRDRVAHGPPDSDSPSDRVSLGRVVSRLTRPLTGGSSDGIRAEPVAWARRLGPIWEFRLQSLESVVR